MLTESRFDKRHAQLRCAGVLVDGRSQPTGRYVRRRNVIGAIVHVRNRQIAHCLEHAHSEPYWHPVCADQNASFPELTCKDQNMLIT